MGRPISFDNNTERLISIESKIDEILATQSPSGLTFDLLNLNPTYQLNSSNGWMVEPQNLATLYDNDLSTASNLFRIGGVSWTYGEIIILPGISMPQFTRIQMKVGLRNINNTRSAFELAAFNITLNSYVNFWASIENVSSTQDVIVNIDSIIPFLWDKLRFRLWDVGQYHAEARFYDLKVWEVS